MISKSESQQLTPNLMIQHPFPDKSASSQSNSSQRCADLHIKEPTRLAIHHRNICLSTFLYAFVCLLLCYPSQGASVFMSLATTNSSVAVSSVFTISFNRSQNALGQVITPSPLATNYIMLMTFSSAYGINSNISSIPTYASINTTTNTLAFSLSAPLNTIVVSGIANPLSSQTALPITLYFYNASNQSVQIDTCSASLTFQALSFSSSAFSYVLEPGNVSSTSNLTLTVTPFVWDSTKMVLHLSMATYWSRNMLNVTANEVLSSLTYCSPACVVQSRGGFFVLEFSGLVQVGSTLTLTVYNILSPATLETADSLSVSIVESTYNSNVQTGSFSITAIHPNQLQILTPATANQVGQQVTLSLNMLSQDLFASTDSIILTLNTSISMAGTVSITNPLVVTYSSQIQQNFKVVLTSFNLVTSIPSQFSGSVVLNNISAQNSVRPVTGNAIGFYRNGALYDYSTFSFAVSPASMSAFTLSLSSNKANELSNLTTAISLTVGVNQTDILYLRVDQAIAVNNCSVLTCPLCSCEITAANANQGILYSSVKVTSFPVVSSGAALTTSMGVMLSVRNPIASGYIIEAATTDSSNYTKETGSSSYPNITSSAIASSVFSLTKTSNVVYANSNYSLNLNFTNQSLINGWMIINFSPLVTLLDPNNPFCLLNGLNGQCSISQVGGAIRANVSISQSINAYVVTVNNLRNPNSTAYFGFQVQLTDSTGLAYYTLSSSNYQASTPYTIVPQVSKTNCTNGQSSTLTVIFPFIPFSPSTATVVDDPAALSLKGQAMLKVLSYPLAFNSSLSVSIVNSQSLQPTYYQLLVKTNDLLYDIFVFNFTLINCQPSTLPILSFLFTGLPEDQGGLTFSIDQLATSPKINYLTVTFPNQYPSTVNISSNAVSTSQLAPRVFNLTVGSAQPITIDVWGFTSVLSSTPFQVRAYALSQALSNITYQISSSTAVILYNLSALTTCSFPCKLCSGGLCLQCYSSALTALHFLDSKTHTCVAAANCSSGTFPDSATNTCKGCPVTCSSCTSSSVCSGCLANFYLLNGSCLTDCPSSYYPISAQQVCELCTSPNNTARCSTCTTLNSCTSCLYPYLLQPAVQTCASACNLNQISSNGTCFDCLSPCATCQGSVSNCSSCLSGYYLYNGSCLTACPSPLVPDSSLACVVCSTACGNCSTSPSSCTSCTYPLKLLSNACINDCPQGYYTHTATASTLQCVLCPSPCLNCSSSTSCQSCQPSYYLLNTTCLAACPLAYHPSIAAPLLCLPCSSNCITCGSSSFCSQCQVGYYLTSTNTSTVCASACASGQYLNSDTCLNCSSNCLTCISSSVCLACTSSTFLLTGTCVASCGSGLAGLSSTFTYLSSSLTTYKCVECIQIYPSCVSCTNTTCTACASTHLLSPTNTCLTSCPTPYFPQAGVCSPCSSECASCLLTASNCSACTSGYLLYTNGTDSRCLPACPSGTFNQSGQCALCVTPCLTCAGSSSGCLTCLSSFYLLNSSASIECVSACPSNSYPYQSTCRFCSASCSACDSNGCSLCATGYYRDGGQIINNTIYYTCYASCPSTLPFLVNNTCIPCSQNCLQCNSTDCLECSSGWVGFGKYCLSQCPPDYGAVAGICVFNVTPPSNITNTTTPPVTSQATIPVPFTLVTLGLSACVLISKYIHRETIVSISVFAVVSLMVALCDLFYLLRGGITQPYQATLPYLFVLMVGVIFSFVNNVIYIFVVKFTLLKDELFILWKRGNVKLIKEDKIEQPSHEKLEDHLNAESEATGEEVPKRIVTYDCLWMTVVIIGTVTSHNIYPIVFSRLFGLSLFGAQVKSVKTFNILNYLWVASLLAFLLCFVSGIVLATSLQPSDTFYLKAVYEATDLIFINFLFLLLGFLLLKKKRSIWSRDATEGRSDDNDSTKKVIFQQDNNDFDMNNIIQSQEQINGKIMNQFNAPMANRQGVISSSSRSSTFEENSDLYFEKQNHQDLDRSKEMYIDGTNIFMQIGADQMHPRDEEIHPDLVEKGQNKQQYDLDETQKTSPNKSKNILLSPEGAMDVIDLNVIEADKDIQSDDKQTEHKEDQTDFAFHQNYGEQAPQSPLKSKSPSKEDNSQDQSNRTSGKLIPIQEQQAQVLQNSRIGNKRNDSGHKQINTEVDNNISGTTIALKSKKGKNKQQGAIERYGSKTIKPDSSLATNIRREEIEQYDLDEQDRRKTQTQQGRRRRKRQKQSKGNKRYVNSPSQLQNKQKQSSRVSGLEDMFNSYKISSPNLKPAQIQKTLKDSPMNVNELCKKQQTFEGRVSSSAQNLRHLLKDRQEQLFFEDKQKPIQQQQYEQQLQNYAHRTIIGQLAQTKPQNLDQNIYKSINIAKLNDRLGGQLPQSQLRAVSRDGYRPVSNLHKNRNTRSVARQFSAEKYIDKNILSKNTVQKKNVWKSRALPAKVHENLGGTTNTIEWKSRIASSKAQLEHIYTPRK